MRFSLRHWVLVGLLPATLLPAAALAEPPPHALAGRVRTEAIPLAGARVYAYQMNDLTLRRVDTDTVGTFLFEELPAGLYKIIAVKTGFVPAIVLLERQTAEARQYLEVDLARRPAAADSDGGDFWNLRRQIPTDVLRDLETLQLAEERPITDSPTESFELARTEFQAMSGTDDRFGSSGQMSRGQVVLSGSVGPTDFDLSGDYWTARPTRQEQASHSTQIALNVVSPLGGSVRLLTSDNKISSELGRVDDIDLERYLLSWSHDLGPGSSRMRAEVVEERNFFAAGSIHPTGVPTASRSWSVEGRYGGFAAGPTTLQTGFRYRQVEEADTELGDLLPSQRIDLFGQGRMALRPQIYVQYGLYSTLRDGSLSLSPQGGVVVEFGPSWTASTMASQKLHEDDARVFDFAPVHYSADDTGCQGETYCYQFQLEHDVDDQTSFSIGATHRRFDETLRLYFSDDFFSHLESLYLVDGDRLPEVQVAMTRRLAPRILARLESSLAEGGGGVFYATDENTYENNVRYLVTSLDTQFERTDTGVFLAFHHLEQQFEPTSVSQLPSYPSADGPITDIEMQRLQVMLTQDLRALDLASLAFQLNMEISRGAGVTTASGATDSEEVYKRFMGGVAVSF